jgi:hypothetical protein
LGLELGLGLGLGLRLAGAKAGVRARVGARVWAGARVWGIGLGSGLRPVEAGPPEATLNTRPMMSSARPLLERLPATMRTQPHRFGAARQDSSRVWGGVPCVIES